MRRCSSRRNIAQSVVDQSNTELTLAESALALAQVQLGKLTIRAPFSGRAGFRGVSIGAYVQAGAPLVHVEKIDLLKAAFSVPELNYSQLALGQSIMVTADAVPGETFEAKISAIDPLLDINGRALRVRADLDNSADKLRPGMLIRVSVRGPSRSSVMVPEAAIVPRSSGAVVFVATGEKAAETKVRTGKRVDGAVEIIEGLKAGTQVVTAGNARLSDGASIAIVPPQPIEAAMTLPELCIRRPVFATVLSLILVLVGLMAFTRLTIREYPNIDEPQVSVSTGYNGASAEIIETQVTQVLEGSLAGIEGIDTIESTSRAESSRITIRFRAGISINSATSDVRDRVSRVRRQLPDEIDEPTHFQS